MRTASSSSVPDFGSVASIVSAFDLGGKVEGHEQQAVGQARIDVHGRAAT